jgi:uncharacterized protein YkwD
MIRLRQMGWTQDNKTTKWAAIVVISSGLLTACVAKSTNVEGGDTIVRGGSSTDAAAGDVEESTPVAEVATDGSSMESGDEAAGSGSKSSTASPDDNADPTQQGSGEQPLTDAEGGAPEAAQPASADASVVGKASESDSGAASEADDDESAVGTSDEADPDTALREAGQPRTHDELFDAGIDTSDAARTPVDPGVPMTDHCAAVADWDEQWKQFEAEVLLLVNEARAAGAECGGSNPVEPVVVNEALTCAARLHSLDMYEREFYSHINPDEEDLGDRMSAVGYTFTAVGENIAAAFETPEAVTNSWLENYEFCMNVMNAQFTELGVGYHPGDPAGLQHLWTQNFGTPRDGSF